MTLRRFALPQNLAARRFCCSPDAEGNVEAIKSGVALLSGRPSVHTPEVAGLYWAIPIANEQRAHGEAQIAERAATPHGSFPIRPLGPIARTLSQVSLGLRIIRWLLQNDFDLLLRDNRAVDFESDHHLSVVNRHSKQLSNSKAKRLLVK